MHDIDEYKYRIDFEKDNASRRIVPTKDHDTLAQAIAEIDRLRGKFAECRGQRAHILEYVDNFVFELPKLGGYPILGGDTVHFAVIDPDGKLRAP